MRFSQQLGRSAICVTIFFKVFAVFSSSCDNLGKRVIEQVRILRPREAGAFSKFLFFAPDPWSHLPPPKRLTGTSVHLRLSQGI